MLEFDFIKKCTEFLPRQAEGLACGIGDDCAVIIGSMGRDLLVSTDAYSESIHFCSEWMNPVDIGARSLIGAVSDIAAMGGRPRYATISLAVPPTISEGNAIDIMKGITSSSSLYQMMVIGGDTIAASHDLQIVLTVIGDIRHGGAVYRRGARSGDVVYVTGTLGGAAAGLEILKSAHQTRAGGDPVLAVGSASGVTVDRFLHPVARISSGQWLTETGCVTSMIDISDGLVQDLGHVAQASGVGVVLDAETIPCWHDAGVAVNLQTACTSGEEYELVFTVDGRRDSAFRRLLPGVQRLLGHPITRIGVTTAGTGVVVRDAAGGDVTPPVGGFRHVIGKGA